MGEGNIVVFCGVGCRVLRIRRGFGFNACLVDAGIFIGDIGMKQHCMSSCIVPVGQSKKNDDAREMKMALSMSKIPYDIERVEKTASSFFSAIQSRPSQSLSCSLGI